MWQEWLRRVSAAVASAVLAGAVLFRGAEPLPHGDVLALLLTLRGGHCSQERPFGDA